MKKKDFLVFTIGNAELKVEFKAHFASIDFHVETQTHL